jgi:hypothetical protein
VTPERGMRAAGKQAFVEASKMNICGQVSKFGTGTFTKHCAIPAQQGG